MYCPYCKEELEVNNGESYCKANDTYFSKHIEKDFHEKIKNCKIDEIPIFEVENIEEGYFFCVNCGNKMKKIDSMHEGCICCGFEIDKSMYFKIIEFNPHC